LTNLIYIPEKFAGLKGKGKMMSPRPTHPRKKLGFECFVSHKYRKEAGQHPKPKGHAQDWST